MSTSLSWTAVPLLLLVVGCNALAPQQRRVATTTKTSGNDHVLAMLRQASEHERAGATDEAETLYREVLTEDTNHVEACHRLAVLADRKGDFASSQQLYQRALSADADNPEIRCDYAYSHYVQGDFTRAESMLRRILGSGPGFSRAHCNLGLVLARQGRSAEAIEQFIAGGCDEQAAKDNVDNVARWTENPVQSQQLAAHTGPDRQKSENALTTDAASPPTQRAVLRAVSVDTSNRIGS